MTIDINDFIPITEAAKVIGVTRAWVHVLIRARELTCIKLGPKVWLARADCERRSEIPRVSRGQRPGMRHRR